MHEGKAIKARASSQMFGERVIGANEDASDFI